MKNAVDRYPIDPALKALAADPRATARRPPAHVPIDKVREAANSAMCRQPAGPALFRVWDEVFVTGEGAELSLRFYRPDAVVPQSGIMFLHGGGFTLGSLDTHDPQCRSLARFSNSLVVSVDYRLAPEHPYPAGLEDCRAAWARVTAGGDELGIGSGRWAIAGDSAGANLALSLALGMRGELARPAALALFYPFLDPGCDSPSSHQLCEGPGLSRDAMLWFWENYLGPQRHAPEAELLKQDLAGLPPISLFLAASDPLLDEGRVLAQALREGHVPLTCRIVEGMVHGFLHLGALTPKADETLRLAAVDLRGMLDATPDPDPEPLNDLPTERMR